jgi:stage II sporulation protein D
MNRCFTSRTYRQRIALIAACALLLTAHASCSSVSSETAGAPPALNEHDTDELLQRAATDALGTRDGTIIILDPQTGRIRAIANERTAYEETLPPGSTVKPFAMLAALDGGIVTDTTRLACATRFRRAQVDLACSHTRPLPALSPSDALAHSCNYFHARLGESLSTAALARTLTRFGFDRRTDPENAREATGSIPHDAAPAGIATGESAALTATPIALITAYLALTNGGHLLTPHRAGTDSSFQIRARSSIRIADDHRRILLAGMRGAVTHGTAAPAELHAIPDAYIFGKTGTATERGGTRPHGWFVGFAADKEFEIDSAPARLRLVVLALVRDAHGVDAARLTRNVFTLFAQSQLTREAKATANNEPLDTNITNDTINTPNEARDRSRIRVRLIREARTLTLPLDEYLFGVLAAEASTETYPEALKAQAVTSRTYALHNLHRHQAQGYDFCNLTHCQRFIRVPDRDARREFYHLVSEAIGETENEILQDEHARPADAYFSASCGGHTASIADLWNAPRAPRHLRGAVDAYCAHTAGEEWTDEIPIARLLPALRTDKRSDVGAYLSDIRITRRDRSGRAARVTLIGERTRTVSGWTLKTIIGRTLGWNVLKSTRFRVTRNAAGFRFQGRGFGHGLGLCQAGAHEMARRSIGYREFSATTCPAHTSARRSDARQGKSAAQFLTPPHRGDSQSQVIRQQGIHRRDAEGAHRVESETSHLASRISDLKSQISNLKSRIVSSLRPLCALCVSAVNPAIPTKIVTDATRRTLSASGIRVSYPATVPRREIESSFSPSSAHAQTSPRDSMPRGCPT